ncbi:pancreatic lipase-related protein 2-like isoform X2 [Neocloeon triangulifer]|uniref:pancreatic lipase-related protein 2-like isoform X2 n=1 Tax=Neocloeon triangulifer TaxID=2078957 RepID=UPI00286F773C|nr:pancreatic lipase-related protein 2-like isoform X2 [Neocloeon triangulifer]
MGLTSLVLLTLISANLCLHSGQTSRPAVFSHNIQTRAVNLGNCDELLRTPLGEAWSAEKIDTRNLFWPVQVKVGFHRESGEWRKGLSKVLGKQETIFIIHGFRNSGRDEWVRKMASALLRAKENSNVIAVDWQNGASPPSFWNYLSAVSNTQVVGKQVAELVRHLNEHLGIPLSDFHLIGHSLGAQVASYVSHHLRGKVGRLTALDPASPCFNLVSNELRVDPEDAEFVDVIHTNGRDKYSLGLMTPVGDVDFYPNGGQEQPSCQRTSRSRSNLWLKAKQVFDVVASSICSHALAVEYFTESISSKCRFWGKHWDLQNRGNGTCRGKRCEAIPMGFESNKFAGRGTFYVKVVNATPHCGQHN